MLKTLLIKNFILIKEAKIDFTSGFNVLCGETGAGKSVIIKALDCVLGAKANKDLALDKTKPIIIEAEFSDNTISREIGSTSKFRLNGILSSQDEIKELRQNLADIHSQHQTYLYMAQKHHITLLDNYIIKKNSEYSELLNTRKSLWGDFLTIEKKLNLLKENLSNNEKEIDFLTFQLKELDDAEVKENEQEELENELDVLSNVQELKEGSYGSFWALYGDNQSIIEALGKINYTIGTLSEMDKSLKETQNSIYDAYETLKDCANFLRDYSSNLELNPSRLDELNERISLIQKLKRKYGQNLDEQREKIANRLEELTGSENNIETLENNYNDIKKSLDLIDEKIEEYRISNAEELSKLIIEKLVNLELKQAQFEISVTQVAQNELGKNKVEFLISTNKNKNPEPLTKVASGGEISRVMLALKTIFASVDKVSTVVFDEIDTGISGITSNAVANSICELAQNTQVISITHQPIICAKANNFIWVTKNHNENTDVKVEILDEQNKLKALAQLASGEISEKTIEFAKTLLTT